MCPACSSFYCSVFIGNDWKACSPPGAIDGNVHDNLLRYLITSGYAVCWPDPDHPVGRWQSCIPVAWKWETCHKDSHQAATMTSTPFTHWGLIQDTSMNIPPEAMMDVDHDHDPSSAQTSAIQGSTFSLQGMLPATLTRWPLPVKVEALLRAQQALVRSYTFSKIRLIPFWSCIYLHTIKIFVFQVISEPR